MKAVCILKAFLDNNKIALQTISIIIPPPKHIFVTARARIICGTVSNKANESLNFQQS